MMHVCLVHVSLEPPRKLLLSVLKQRPEYCFLEQNANTTIAMGELSESDLQQPYRSAASNTFRSYIVDPEATKDETDRNLYKR